MRTFHFDLREHLEVIVIGIVLITTLPIIIKLIFPGKKTTETITDQKDIEA
jgi:membrane-associated protein